MLTNSMNRAEFQSLAIERLGDAEALLSAGRYSRSYYVTGYCIECALKACIARKTMQDEFPPKDGPKYYVHDLTRLLDYAGLGHAFAEKAGNDTAFLSNWAIVKDWTEEARYQTRGQLQAVEILAAVKDPEHGVLQWLKGNW